MPDLVKPSTKFVILDCNYELEDPSLSLAKVGLVVKWYLNGYSNMVYQWIPPKSPQGHGVLKDNLNLDYTITNEPYTKHRALYIINPTANFTGDYTCQVSSIIHEGDASKNALMTVHCKY